MTATATEVVPIHDHSIKAAPTLPVPLAETDARSSTCIAPISSTSTRSASG